MFPLLPKKLLKFKVKVVMMCGCPTRPGGLWDSSKFKMKAFIKNDGEIVKTLPLTFTGETNIFKSSFNVNESGNYTIVAVVFDPRTENSGLAAETIRLK